MSVVNVSFESLCYNDFPLIRGSCYEVNFSFGRDSGCMDLLDGRNVRLSTLVGFNVLFCHNSLDLGDRSERI